MMAFLLASCNMGAFYANKRIAHSEDILAPKTTFNEAKKETRTIRDKPDEIFFETEDVIISRDFPDSNRVKEPVIKKQKKSKKEEKINSDKKIETNNQGVPIYKPKEETKEKSTNGEYHANAWIFWGSIVLISVIVGLLTKSVWIGLLVFGGILVLLFVLILVFALLFFI